MTSGVQAKMGKAMGGMLEKVEANPALFSCVAAVVGSLALTMAVAAMGGSLSVTASLPLSGVMVTGGLLLYGRHYVIKHYGEKDWVKKARKALRIALPIVFSAAFIAVAVVLSIHVAHLRSIPALGMGEMMPLFLGSGLGAMGLYAAGHLFSQGKEKKKWYRTLHYTAVVASGILLPVGYLGVCALMMSGGPTTILFYGGLIATGFFPDVLSVAAGRLFKPMRKTWEIKEPPRRACPPAGTVPARYREEAFLSGLKTDRHRAMKNLFPFGLSEIHSEDLKEFQNSAELKKQVEKAFKKAIVFYGFEWDNDQIVRAKDFKRKKREWMVSGSLHYQDITRMLWFMRTIGLGGGSDELYERLQSVINDEVDPKTKGAWKGASGVKGD